MQSRAKACTTLTQAASGGDLGSDAQAGGPSVSWDLFPGGYSGGAGGLGGGAVSGNSFITWINTGTRIGAIG